MNGPLDRQIRERLVRYVRGEMTLRDFNRWFMPATWNVHQTADMATRRLVGAIGLALAELSVGHATEAEVQDELRALIGNEEDSTATGQFPLSRTADLPEIRTAIASNRWEGANPRVAVLRPAPSVAMAGIAMHSTPSLWSVNDVDWRSIAHTSSQPLSRVYASSGSVDVSFR